MHYALTIYPELSAELSDAIRAIRAKYDPTARFVGPHITVLFPVPDRVGKEQLIDHIAAVLRDQSPFDITLGGFHKSRDHWLFLILQDGADTVRAIYRRMYTGILSEFRRDDIDFVPHVGLGLFLKDGCVYDWNNPQEADLDRERYDVALEKARALPLPWTFTVTSLHMTAIRDELLEWARGARHHFPGDGRVDQVRAFPLGDHPPAE